MENSVSFTSVHAHIEKIMPLIEKPAAGKIPFPYLMVSYGKAYGGMVFGWDHHHMAMRFAHAGRPEYLRYLADNLLTYQTGDGYTPNCITCDDGPMQYEPRFHAQPFLMQGTAMYVAQTRDISWAKQQFPKLQRYLNYYETSCRAPYGLFRWPLSWMSGFDNDVVTNFFQPETVISADLSAWIYLEYRAAGELSATLDRPDVAEEYAQKAETLKTVINDVLWYDKVKSYSAFDLCRQKPLFHLAVPDLEGTIGYYSYQSCSNLIPLYAGIASESQGREMIERYVLSEDHFLSPYGIRSLSKSSEFYNNAVWGNPSRFGDHRRPTNSNWQGPVWVPLCYFIFRALRQYGFTAEARDLADRTHRLLAQSLQSIGSFTENFDAETGQPLYAPNFASWNLLADMMQPE